MAHEKIVNSKQHVDLSGAAAGDILTLTDIQQQRAQSGQELSKHPYFTMSMEINASSLFADNNQWTEEKRPSFTTLLVQQAGKILQIFPLLNGTYVTEERIKLHHHAHIAVAVDTPSGMVFPVLLDVNQQTILDLDHELKRLTEKARHDGLSPHDIEGATFTVANLGMFGVTEFRPMIYTPQLAVLAIGAISYRLVMTGNRIINLPFFTITMTCDACVIDAAMSAQFLRKLKEGLEE